MKQKGSKSIFSDLQYVSYDFLYRYCVYCSNAAPKNCKLDLRISSST